jgi:hypothetical protein
VLLGVSKGEGLEHERIQYATVDGEQESSGKRKRRRPRGNLKLETGSKNGYKLLGIGNIEGQG